MKARWLPAPAGLDGDTQPLVHLPACQHPFPFTCSGATLKPSFSPALSIHLCGLCISKPNTHLKLPFLTLTITQAAIIQKMLLSQPPPDFNYVRASEVHVQLDPRFKPSTPRCPVPDQVQALPFHIAYTRNAWVLC